MTDERTLVLQLKNGSESAFTTLYEMYWAKVYNYSLLYLTSSTEAEEVVQEVFIKVWEARLSIKENENFKGYLFIITRNLIFNQFRKSFNENTYKMTILKSVNNSHSIEDELVASDLHLLINKLVNKLPPRQQETFRLSREKHLSYKEIAQQLNITEKTVERHINEALKFLKKHI